MENSWTSNEVNGSSSEFAMTPHEQQQFDQRSRQLQAVRRVTGALYQTTGLLSIQALALDVALDVIGTDAGSILLFDEQRDMLVFEEVRGPVADHLKGVTLPIDEDSVAANVYLTETPSITNNANADPHHTTQVDESMGYLTRSLLTVPLRARATHPLGVFQLVNKREGDFDSADAAVLESMGNVVSIAIEHARLAQEAQVAAVARAIGEIGHDIGNMLSGVLPYVQTIGTFLDDAQSGDPKAIADLTTFYHVALEEVTDGVARIQSLARDIGAAVKGEITEPDFAQERYCDVVEQVFRSLAESARKVDVTLELTGETELRVVCDIRRMYNALYNLVNNALAETPPGGRIGVHISAHVDWYEVSVSDTGKGMTEEIRAVVFTDAAKSTKPNGTGLGTRIVRRAVEQHGGEIHVESTLGQGTTIRLRMPTQL